MSPLRVGIHNGTYKVENADSEGGGTRWQWTVAPQTEGVQYFSPAPRVGRSAVCWHCCSPFSGVVHPLPTSYDARKKAYLFVGCFCGWGCVKGYNLEVNGGKYVHREICMHIARLMAHTGAGDCAAAPPRINLRMFGGRLELQDFRSACRSVTCAAEVHGSRPAVTEPPPGTGAPANAGGRGGRSGAKRGRVGGGGGGAQHMRLDQLGFTTRN